MQHVTKAGQAKLVDRCSLPPTGRGVVSRIVTDLAVLDVPVHASRSSKSPPGSARTNFSRR